MISSRCPAAAYRLQFNRNFNFAAAEALVPFLHELGISDIYASPLFQAVRGSLHGYSVTNPMELNAELGSRKDFDSLVRKLKKQNMGLIFDIVPNHMALSQDNPWWMEVLENGPVSPYAIFFDVDWHPPNRLLEGKLLLPILGRPYSEALEGQELRLSLEPGGFCISYYENRFPLDPKTYDDILSPLLERQAEILGEAHPAIIALRGIISLIANLPSRHRSSPQKVRDRQRDKEIIKNNLRLLYDGASEMRKVLDETIQNFNGVKGKPESFDVLDRLLQRQAYRLAYWQVALEMINYRRFFSINDLIGIRIEDPQVFEAFKHGLLFKLADEGSLSGLRVDHIDGLFDPLDYLQRLQQRLKMEEGRQNFYIVVEKILAAQESLPPEWPVAGTTGYDFLNMLNGVFIDQRGLKKLQGIYSRFVQVRLDLPELIRDKKKLILRALFGGEVENHVYYLCQLANQDRLARDLSRRNLMEALVEVTATLPVYRTYIRGFEVPQRDRAYLEQTFKAVRQQSPHLKQAALDFLERVLLLDFPRGLSSEQKKDWLDFVMHWQQFTGPTMAKGFEDTVLYIYNPLVSMNEVGGAWQPVTAPGLHQFHLRRQAGCRDTLNTTSTHDTKRSEDVRARLNVLAEIPAEWEACLKRWSRQNQVRKIEVAGNLVPDPNQEVFLYQTMLGAWPLNPEEIPAFKERLQNHLIKAAREAMVHSRWISPQVEHEKALSAFVEAILDEAGNQEFLEDFRQFQGRLAYFGALNSLSQVLLKIAAPGVPDFYQGTELWDFSLVDPDNRRPVDFPIRARLLQEIKQQEKRRRNDLASRLLGGWQDGRIKLYLTYRALNFRRKHQELFRQGEYLPLKVKGSRDSQVLAWARRQGGDWVLAIAGRFFTRMSHPGQPPVGREVWGDNALLLPPAAPNDWREVITGATCQTTGAAAEKRLPLEQVFRQLPVALLSGSD